MEPRTWKGSLIPPAAITPCGHLTDTPEKFHSSACEEADRISRDIGLCRSSAILDIGCGAGRLPIGLLARRAEFSFYLGVDVSRDRVDWCTHNLSAQDARLHFQFIDMPNARYNPGGQASLRLSVPPASFDVVYLYSVFSHLLEPDVRSYLDLIARVMRPGGVCFTTMFVADDVPPVTENPADFGPLEWSGPLHCVRYDRRHWQAMLASAGLAVVREAPRVNADEQTGYFLIHQSRHRGAGALGSRQARRSFVGFFGLNRSLRWTRDSIERNVLGPLAEAGLEPVIATHFNCPPTIHSPRSGEFHVPFHMMGVEELYPELVWLEPQRDSNVAGELPLVLRTPFKNEEDPEGITRRNVLHQLHSLSRLALLLDALGPGSFDLIVLTRADLMFLDPVPVDEIVEMIRRGVDLVTPGWHRWTGLNDRFAFCSLRGAQAYLNRRRWVRSLCEESGTFHSESLLLHAAEKAGLECAFTSVRARRVRASGAVRDEDFSQ